MTSDCKGFRVRPYIPHMAIVRPDPNGTYFRNITSHRNVGPPGHRADTSDRGTLWPRYRHRIPRLRRSDASALRRIGDDGLK